MSLREYLTAEAANWEFTGMPALMQRFVLRNGKEYQPVKRIGRKGAPKECFSNATNVVLCKPVADGWRYVEGFALHREHPLMAFHHAWVTTNGDDAMDPTLDADEYWYHGIAFDKPTVVEHIERTGYCGLLDTGFGLNVKLMFDMDPELKDIVEAVKPNSAWTTAQKVMTAVVLAALVLLPHDLHAQQATVYGSDGRVQSRTVTSPSGSTVVYGRDGRVEATTTTSPTTGVTTVYGRDGRVRERIAPNSGRRP